MIRLGILGSTRGTHLIALQEAIIHQKLAAKIVVVLSNKADAKILSRAKDFAIDHFFIDPESLTREVYDLKYSKLLQAYQVDLIVLIGYMRILSADFIATWPNKIINIHPSLLPLHRGKMDLDVHRAVLAGDEQQTGCTVHYVSEEVDAGPILLQKTCAVYPHDTAETIKCRVQSLEAAALIEAINHLNTFVRDKIKAI